MFFLGRRQPQGQGFLGGPHGLRPLCANTEQVQLKGRSTLQGQGKKNYHVSKVWIVKNSDIRYSEPLLTTMSFVRNN